MLDCLKDMSINSFSPQKALPCGVDIISIPIFFHLKNPKHKTIKSVAQSHTLADGSSRQAGLSAHHGAVPPTTENSPRSPRGSKARAVQPDPSRSKFQCQSLTAVTRTSPPASLSLVGLVCNVDMVTTGLTHFVG